ncbi:hypothetical protein PMAYCL1PPCAC_26136, partial [Pristionchus mayeri]
LVEYISSQGWNVSCLTVGRLSFIRDRDQVFLGTEDGNVVVVDVVPTKQQARPASGNPAMMQQDSVMLMHPVGAPVLQICTGTFVANYSAHTIAVLTPKVLIMYDVEGADSDTPPYLTQMYSHNLVETAFKMVPIPLQSDDYNHLLVMGIGANMSIYDGDQCVLSRVISTSLHPGPLAVCVATASIVVGSSGTVRCVKYSLLASHSVGGKKLNFDWSVAVGDAVVDIQITQNEVMPNIMTLCRRSLVALTPHGEILFCFDLQCIGLAMKSFSRGAAQYTISIVSTNTGAILVLRDNILQWTSHTPFVARFLDLCDAREAMGMLAIADSNQLFVGYLGSEPSLYRIPIAPNRSVDYVGKKQQMVEFEEQIRMYGGGGTEDSAKVVLKELKASLEASGLDNPTVS